MIYTISGLLASRLHECSCFGDASPYFLARFFARRGVTGIVRLPSVDVVSSARFLGQYFMNALNRLSNCIQDATTGRLYMDYYMYWSSDGSLCIHSDPNSSRRCWMVPDSVQMVPDGF